MTRATPSTADAIQFDPDSVLMREPGILLNSQFLGSLHRELEAKHGNLQAEITLFQMGFLHGLQDAMQAVSDAFGSEKWDAQNLVGPSLAFRLNAQAPATAGASEAAISFQGIWPERTEATARLAALGHPLHPTCFLTAGYTSGWLSGTLEADILALETSCSACGAESCNFTAHEASVWREIGEPDSLRFLDALPFTAFRNFVQTNYTAKDDPPADSQRFDPNASIIHIWGPVMVIPFSGSDEALQAIELIGHDPAARDVSVVIVDLTGAILDDGFGAAALERIVDTIEAWGAEAIFASVSPLSEPVVAELERQPLFIHKDLSQAIAAAFQIANSQRSPV